MLGRAAGLLALAGLAATGVYTVREETKERTLRLSYVFRDEFNGPAGAAPDPSKWGYDLGRWPGNNELETYTDSRANSYLDGQGHLVIRALRGPPGSAAYTSARLTTQGIFSRNHGDFEARIKFDRAIGTWPAWWMIGDDYPSVGWPRCGEIDMIEVYGQPGWQPNSSVHTANNRGQDTRKEAPVPVPGGVDTGWHVWYLHWEKNILQFSKDNKVYLTVRPSDLPNWPFNRPAFMILNLAVGGEGGGPVPANFSSAQMVIDYVRVW